MRAREKRPMTLPMTEIVGPAPLRPVPTGFTEPLQTFPAELFDGWVVHSAALRRGMNTLLFPGQALMAFYGTDHTTGAAFAHGVPNQTWLSAATLVQDTRIRRDVLSSAGVPVPRGRAFSLKRGLPYAKDFAMELGYPVVVKPMVGESTVEVVPGLEDEAHLEDAVDYLRRVPTMRPDFTTSSYAFTQILTPKTGKSTRTRDTYRYLVEKHVTGQQLRLLVSEGRLLSAVHIPHGPWRSHDVAADVTDQLHPDVRDFAGRIWDAVPGLSIMAADIVLEDWQAPLTEATLPVVVEVAERPWMHVQQAVSEELVAAHGQMIVEASTPGPLHDDRGSAPITADFRWDGLSQIDVDVDRATMTAEKLDLTFTVSTSDPVSGVLSGEVEGPSRTIALFNELLIEGSILTSPAMCIETRTKHSEEVP